MHHLNGHSKNNPSANGNGNGNGKNGKSHQNQIATAAPEAPPSTNPLSAFVSPEQGVVFRQSPTWSRGVIWTIMAVTAAAFIWAAVAPIEQVVQGTGQLKPQGKVKEVQPSVNGVVKAVYVKDGDKVKEGQVLLVFDSAASLAELESQQKIRKSVKQENQFYETLMNESLSPSQVEIFLAQLKLPKEVVALARNRITLLEENQLYRIQLGESVNQANLKPAEVSRLQAAKRELQSRAMAAKLEMSQLQKQLSQNQVQLIDARTQLINDRKVLEEIKNRNQKVMKEAEAGLKIEQQILQDITPLESEGALARYQINKQQQAVTDRQAEMAEKRANGLVEYEKQIQQIQTRLAEIDKYQEETLRLQFAIAQAKEKYDNTQLLTEKEVRDKIASNDQRIAEIDSQLTKILVENNKKIDEIDSQIMQSRQTLKYQELKAPVAGTVFDLQAYPGFVPKPSQAEALLKIVPKDYFIAEVDITNQDIGFVRPGMKADIRIDSFPFSEYGDIKGQVKSIGSDALPPDETHKYYRFPTRVTLDNQYLQVEDRQIPLQSGMSVSVNIKIREHRTVLSLFTEQFTRSVESLKEMK